MFYPRGLSLELNPLPPFLPSWSTGILVRNRFFTDSVLLTLPGIYLVRKGTKKGSAESVRIAMFLVFGFVSY